MLSEGPRIIEFAESFCVHTDGPLMGKPIVLADFQRQILTELFEIGGDGYWRQPGARSAGSRLLAARPVRKNRRAIRG